MRILPAIFLVMAAGANAAFANLAPILAGYQNYGAHQGGFTDHFSHACA